MNSLALLALAALPAAQAPTTARVRVDVLPDSPEHALLAAEGFDVDHGREGDHTGFPGHGGTWVELFVPDADLPRLAALGLPWTILDRGRPLRDRIATGDLDSRYYDWDEINQELLALQNQYPGLAERVDLNARYGGPLTHEGRNIHVLKISDAVGLDEAEPAMVWVGNHHAREIATPAHVIEWARELLSRYGSDPQVTAWVDTHEIWLAPTMNPDGLEHVWNVDDYWRKNRRNNGGGVYGVDLNRNYPFDWAACGSFSTSPSSNVYCGPAPASEPEVQTWMAFLRAERPWKMIDLHQSGREVLHPYACSTMPGAPAAKVAEVRDLLAAAAGYSHRHAAAGGEQFEWAFAEIGALSYLLELQTQFHPSWSEFQSEFARVLPAYEAMAGVAAPLRGRVLDAATGAPLDGATVDAAGLTWPNGETRGSGGGHGLFALWLPDGPWTLTVTLAGRDPVTLQAEALGSGAGGALDVFLARHDLPHLHLEGAAVAGSQLRFRTVAAQAHVGELAALRLSQSGGGPFVPGYSAGGGITVPLVHDNATNWCEARPHLVERTIDGSGEAVTAWLRVPPAAAGRSVWAAAILSSGGVAVGVTPALPFTVQ